jgi:hypothetical protein
LIKKPEACDYPSRSISCPCPTILKAFKVARRRGCRLADPDVFYQTFEKVKLHYSIKKSIESWCALISVINFAQCLATAAAVSLVGNGVVELAKNSLNLIKNFLLCPPSFAPPNKKCQL